MNNFDLLMVIAQVSVAFAGFASLASALGDRSNPEETPVAGRLANMLVASLCTAMLALVPTIPALFGLTESIVWRSSALVAILTWVSVIPGVLTRTKRMKQYAGYNAATSTAGIGLAAIAGLGFSASALGFRAGHLPATYIGGLLALVLVSAMLFFRIITSLLRPHAPE
jgi:MFS family permease